ncbi:MAG: hypothetical protein WBF17_23620, partial [Phycisphaerae bacterium]
MQPCLSPVHLREPLSLADPPDYLTLKPARLTERLSGERTRGAAAAEDGKETAVAFFRRYLGSWV